MPPDALVRSGLLFLLKQKDRYGVWYSTQATINVLDAMLTLLEDGRTPANAQPEVPQIIVNGNVVPRSNQAAPNDAVWEVSIAAFLRPGPNRIEIQRGSRVSLASAQATASFYVPWSDSNAKNTNRGDANALRLTTEFDKTAGRLGDEFTCRVRAERMGFGGYGMMLAEIGLPPGAEVDRASLESAMTASGWAINSYDVLPDKLLVYLWPRAGGVSFDFKFRPRFGLVAKSAPAIIYDYYNPEARAVVTPVKFTIK